MREGLRNTINREPDLVVCGEAEAAPAAMEAVKRLTPDLVLVDVTLPGKSGLELVKDLKALHPHLRILALSMHDESLYAERVLRAGAQGYITKQEATRKMLTAIRKILGGKTYLSDSTSEQILTRLNLRLQGAEHVLTRGRSGQGDSDLFEGVHTHTDGQGLTPRKHGIGTIGSGLDSRADQISE